MAEYEPGACNIGAAERARRRSIEYVGFLAGGVVVVAVAFFELDSIWLLASAAPFYGGSSASVRPARDSVWVSSLAVLLSGAIYAVDVVLA